MVRIGAGGRLAVWLDKGGGEPGHIKPRSELTLCEVGEWRGYSLTGSMLETPAEASELPYVYRGKWLR